MTESADISPRVPPATRKVEAETLRDFLEREIWTQVPRALQGRRLSKKRVEKVLGYGPEGV